MEIILETFLSACPMKQKEMHNCSKRKLQTEQQAPMPIIMMTKIQIEVT